MNSFTETKNRTVDDIDIIFHNAALKHVVACEYTPFEACIMGMQKLIDVEVDNNLY